jgi:CHAT domain-containing protein/Tfp pilus assembly protein PilF
MKNPICFTIIFCAFCTFQSTVTSQTFESDTELASTLYKKGIDAKSRFELDSAGVFFGKAAILFEKHEVWDNYLISSNESGIVLLQKGKIPEAIELYTKLIALATEHFEEMNEYSANLYNNLGKAYFFKGDIDAALELYDKSLAIRGQIKDLESFFASDLFNDFGNAYTEKGELDLALEYYKKALAIRLKLLGGNHPETALSYNNLGIVYKEQAKYDEAIKYHQKAIEIQRSIYGDNYPELANYYQGIGNAYKEKGELEPAMEFYQKAYSIRKKAFTDNHPLTAKDMINIANVYSERGDIDNASGFFQKALAIQKKVLGDNHPDLAITYNNLGNIYNMLQNFDLALSFYNNALEIKKAVVGENHPEIADYLNNIGNIHSAKREFEHAMDYYKQSLELKIQFYGRKHPAVVLPYLSMGNIYYQMGDYNMALQYFQRSLASNVKDFNPEPSNTYFNPTITNYYNSDVLLRSLRGKAKALVGNYRANLSLLDLTVAFETFQKCDTIINVIRATSISKNDKIELGKIASEVYDQAIDVCFNLNQLDKNKEAGFYLKQAFYFSEKNKAGALLEALAASEASKFAGIPDSLIDLERAYNMQIAFYEKKLAETYDAQNEQTVRNALFAINRQYTQLISDFEKNYPKYHEMKYSKENLSLQQVQDCLDDETALLSYFAGDSLISIFTITKNTIALDKSIRKKSFDLEIFDFRNNLTSNYATDVKSYISHAREFYKLLFPGSIPENIKRLIIIPDGNLGMIPFETLLTEELSGNINQFSNYPYLIKKYQVAYNYSANLFYKQNTRRRSENNAKSSAWIGIAPVFSQTGDLIIDGNYITALPGSETEILTIGGKMESKKWKNKALLFTEASEAFMKSPEIKNYNYLHIATHGFVNSEKPELSGIVMSENKDGENDGVLYLGEIYNMELNADLVILSACETGLGKVSKGEGVIGLTRALLYAGTRDIIVSLWKVADMSTSELMIDFYDYLLEKEVNTNRFYLYTEALHHSKTKMINSKNFGHPFFWSPFILIGQ